MSSDSHAGRHACTKPKTRSQHPRQGLRQAGQGACDTLARTHAHTRARARRHACKQPKTRSEHRCLGARACVLTCEHSKRRTASEAKRKFIRGLSVMRKGFAAVACSRDRNCHAILLDRTEAMMRQIDSFARRFRTGRNATGAPRRVRKVQVTRPRLGASDSGDLRWQFTVACNIFQRFRFMAIIKHPGRSCSAKWACYRRVRKSKANTRHVSVNALRNVIFF